MSLIEAKAVWKRTDCLVVFFFNDTATTEIYTLSLHDALPIFLRLAAESSRSRQQARPRGRLQRSDRKSTRLNSSHVAISYAVFCLKKKNTRWRGLGAKKSAQQQNDAKTIHHYLVISCFFFFNDTATTEIYTLSLHDALPISRRGPPRAGLFASAPLGRTRKAQRSEEHTSELQSRGHLVCRLLLEKKKKK